MAKNKLKMPRKHPPDKFHARPYFKAPGKPLRLDDMTQAEKPAVKRQRKD